MILRDPPSNITSAFGFVSPSSQAATNEAHAPEPQANVLPTPLSQTFVLILFLFITSQISTFTFAGKSGSFSIIGRIFWIFNVFKSLVKNTMWGFPTLIARPFFKDNFS